MPSLAAAPSAAGWIALEEDPWLEMVASCNLLDHGSQIQLGPSERPIYWLPSDPTGGFDRLLFATVLPGPPYPRGQMVVDYVEFAGPPEALQAAAGVAVAAVAAVAAAAAGCVGFDGLVGTVGLAPLLGRVCSSSLFFSELSWPGAPGPDPHLLAASRPSDLKRQQTRHLCRPGARWNAAALGVYQHHPLKQQLNPEVTQPSQVPAGQAELGLRQAVHSEMVGAAKDQNSHRWQEVHSPDLEPHLAGKGFVWRCPWGCQKRALAWFCDLEVASEAELTSQ